MADSPLCSSVMADHTHITAGRTALRVLLAAVVVAAGIAGTVGTAVESLDGKGNDSFPPSLYESRMVGPFDRTGYDATIHAFPINNVTVYSATYVGRGGGSGKPSF